MVRWIRPLILMIVLTLVLVGGAPESGAAQAAAPAATIDSHSGSLNVNCNQNGHGPGSKQDGATAPPDARAWNESRSVDCQTASAYADMEFVETVVGGEIRGVSASGSHSSQAGQSGIMVGDSQSYSIYRLNFTVATPTEYTLRGGVSASQTLSHWNVSASVSLIGPDNPNSTPLATAGVVVGPPCNNSSCPDIPSVDASGTLAPGAYVLVAAASGYADPASPPQSASTVAAFDFEFTLDPVVHSVEFTQGIQEVQTLSELQTSLGDGSGVSGQGQQPVGSSSSVAGFDIAFQSGGSIVIGNTRTGATKNIGGGQYPAWSPDGGRIAYFGGGIWVFDANAGTRIQVAQTPAGYTDIFPSFSPDGTKVAFARLWTSGGESRPDGHLIVVPATGGPEQIVASLPSEGKFGDGGMSGQVDWSSNDEIAFSGIDVANGPVGMDAFKAPGSGGGIQNLTMTAATTDNWNYEFVGNWSKDGEELFFLARESTTKPAGLVAKVPRNGGGRTTLFQVAGVWDIDVSPDGRQVAMDAPGGSGAGSPFDGIVIVDINGSNMQTPFPGVQGGYADWRPPAIDSVEVTQAIQELQMIDAMQADLAGDGKPPVPIVAGKPAAMRVYFEEVQQATTYTVDLTGEFQRTEQVTLQPGCTPELQRKQTAPPQGGGICHSVDLYFTPPEGQWTVTLEVKEAGATIEDHEFSLTSVDMGELDVEYLPICVKLTVGATATCPTASIGNTGADYMKEVFPIAPGDLQYSRFPVPAMELDAPMSTAAEAVALVADIRLRYNLMALGWLAPDQVAGWIPPGGHSAGIIGISDPIWAGGGRTGHVSWNMDQNTTADPLLGEYVLAHEVAHNLGRRHPNKADSCGAADGGTDWPATYTDSTIQEVGFDMDAGTAIPASRKDLLTYCNSPASNIWISPHTYNKLVQSAFVPQGLGVSPAGAPIQQLVIKGSAKADGSAATIESAYVITTATPADQPNPLGNYCLRTSGGAVLDYCFQLNFQEHQTGAPMDSESFSLRMPLPEGTTRMSLAKGFQELDALELSASVPSVELAEPDELQGEETIEWSGSDGDGDPLQYALMYTPDDGQTWYPIAVDLTESEFTFDTSVLEGDEILIRVLASDGLNTTVDTTGPVTVIHGTERTWGDNNCSGAVDPVDALLTLRFNSGLSTATGECPAFGEEVEVPGGETFAWGDVDCTGDVGPVDALKVLRHDSGLSVSQEAECPAMGGGVVVAALQSGMVGAVTERESVVQREGLQADD